MYWNCLYWLSKCTIKVHQKEKHQRKQERGENKRIQFGLETKFCKKRKKKLKKIWKNKRGIPQNGMKLFNSFWDCSIRFQMTIECLFWKTNNWNWVCHWFPSFECYMDLSFFSQRKVQPKREFKPEAYFYVLSLNLSSRLPNLIVIELEKWFWFHVLINVNWKNQWTINIRTTAKPKSKSEEETRKPLLT